MADAASREPCPGGDAMGQPRMASASIAKAHPVPPPRGHELEKGAVEAAWKAKDCKRSPLLCCEQVVTLLALASPTVDG
eukprot:Skav211950  [mRNA]  locus=scaffold1559:11477:12032:- [translate_table: standard]